MSSIYGGSAVTPMLLPDLKQTNPKRSDYVKNKQIFASAINNTASGSAVAITDISPIEHTLDVRVRSKNIIPYPYYTASNGDGMIYNIGEDGRFVANGITTVGTNFYFAFTLELAPATYTYSYQGTISADNEVYLFIHSLTTQQTLAALTPTKKETTFTITEKMTVRVYLNIPLAGVNVNCDLYPQLEIGTTATEYTPYIADVSMAKVNKCGGNLIPYPFSVSTTTNNGITFTDNGDGTITANGTPTDFAIYYFMVKPFVLPRGTYTFSGTPKGSAYETYYFGIAASLDGVNFEKGVYENGLTVEMDTVRAIYVVVKEGNTANNLIFKPQIELGTVATEFEPYKQPTPYTINPDGTVEGVTSIYPTTTLIPDTEGIVLDVEYYADTKKYIDNIKAELQALILEG